MLRLRRHVDDYFDRLDVYDVVRRARIARYENVKSAWQAVPTFEPNTGRVQLSLMQARSATDLEPNGYWAELDEAGQFRVAGRFPGRFIRNAVWTTAGIAFHSLQVRRLLLQGPGGERTELSGYFPGPYFDVAATGDAVYSNYTQRP